jgi:DNA-binding transcriptional regulator YiaG
MRSHQLLVESANINHWSVSRQLISIYTDGKEDKNMNQETIGKFVAACRKEKGLTQKQLAEKLKITDRAVSKWETGVSHS